MGPRVTAIAAVAAGLVTMLGCSSTPPDAATSPAANATPPARTTINKPDKKTGSAMPTINPQANPDAMMGSKIKIGK